MESIAPRSPTRINEDSNRRQARSQRLAELDGHLVAAVAELSGSDHFACVRDAARAVAEYLHVAGLADGQGILQEERDAADGGVAGGDVVGGVGEGAIEDGELGLRLDGTAVVAASVGGGSGDR